MKEKKMHGVHGISIRRVMRDICCVCQKLDYVDTRRFVSFVALFFDLHASLYVALS